MHRFRDLVLPLMASISFTSAAYLVSTNTHNELLTTDVNKPTNTTLSSPFPILTSPDPTAKCQIFTSPDRCPKFAPFSPDNTINLSTLRNQCLLSDEDASITSFGLGSGCMNYKDVTKVYFYDCKGCIEDPAAVRCHSWSMKIKDWPVGRCFDHWSKPYKFPFEKVQGIRFK